MVEEAEATKIQAEKDAEFKRFVDAAAEATRIQAIKEAEKKRLTEEAEAAKI